MLGGALIQMAFNMGNALGAFAGGLPMACGLSYRYAALVGVPVVLLGFLSMLVFRAKYERKAEQKGGY